MDCDALPDDPDAPAWRPATLAGLDANRGECLQLFERQCREFLTEASLSAADVERAVSSSLQKVAAYIDASQARMRRDLAAEAARADDGYLH